ncbi:MAG: hypothetical protein IBJ10_09860, partial [Phycisphaerales bacterium]|nr:hypothetical protein [Phycisphaerales bacterium]
MSKTPTAVEERSGSDSRPTRPRAEGSGQGSGGQQNSGESRPQGGGQGEGQNRPQGQQG